MLSALQEINKQQRTVVDKQKQIQEAFQYHQYFEQGLKSKNLSLTDLDEDFVENYKKRKERDEKLVEEYGDLQKSTKRPRIAPKTQKKETESSSSSADLINNQETRTEMLELKRLFSFNEYTFDQALERFSQFWESLFKNAENASRVSQFSGKSDLKIENPKSKIGFLEFSLFYPLKAPDNLEKWLNSSSDPNAPQNQDKLLKILHNNLKVLLKLFFLFGETKRTKHVVSKIFKFETENKDFLQKLQQTLISSEVCEEIISEYITQYKRLEDFSACAPYLLNSNNKSPTFDPNNIDPEIAEKIEKVKAVERNGMQEAVKFFRKTVQSKCASWLCSKISINNQDVLVCKSPNFYEILMAGLMNTRSFDLVEKLFSEVSLNPASLSSDCVKTQIQMLVMTGREDKAREMMENFKVKNQGKFFSNSQKLALKILFEGKSTASGTFASLQGKKKNAGILSILEDLTKELIAK